MALLPGLLTSRHDQGSEVHLNSQEVSQGRRKQSGVDPRLWWGLEEPLKNEPVSLRDTLAREIPSWDGVSHSESWVCSLGQDED